MSDNDIETYSLRDAVETWISTLGADEFHTLVARTRAPDEIMLATRTNIEATQ